MGIIKAIAGAIGGGLADSWLEVYESDSMHDATVFTTGVKVRKARRIPCPMVPSFTFMITSACCS